MSTVNVNWSGDMSFDAEVTGFNLKLDAKEAVGGKNRGPRPKPLVLVALGGCTGMDVVSILNKMRVTFDSLDIQIDGELTDEHPKYYHKIHIKYVFKGENLQTAKLEKAVNLSMERYCGVTAMLEKVAKITTEIVVDE
jgi:putative redox protein